MNYFVEKDSGTDDQYTTCKLYPTYGGVFSKAVTLFEGEKITYFITERREDGTERSMPLVTLEKERDVAQSHTKYSSINRMRKLAATGKQALLAKEAEQCRFLEMAAEQLFPLK